MEMEIEASKLIKYLEIVEGKGSGSISECKIESNADGIVCCATDPVNSRITKAVLYKSVFKKFTPSEEPIVTMQLSKLISVLKRFEGIIRIKVQKNRMYVASEKRDGDLSLASSDMISDAKFPNFKYDVVFEADSPMFKEALSNATAVDSEVFHLKGKDGHFMIISGTDSGSELIEKTKADTKEFEVYFRAGADSAFKFFDGKVKISASSNRPCMFETKTKEMMITTIIAPIDISKGMEEKKDEKKEE